MIRSAFGDPIIDSEFESLLPPMSLESLSRLSSKLQKEGCREKLIVWKETGLLIEGHHRFKLCKELNLQCDYEMMSFPDRDTVIEWMVNNQLARRNLSDTQRAYFIGKQYLQAKKRSGRPDANDNNVSTVDTLEETNTANRIGLKNKVGPTTVRRDAKFTSAVDDLSKEDPAIREEILNSEFNATKKDVIDAAKTGINQLFCKRCTRVGVVKNCEACKQLRERIKGKSSQNDRVDKPKIDNTFRWEQYDKALGVVVRGCNDVALIHPEERKSEEYKECIRLMREYVKLWKGWHKRLTSSQKQ